MSPEPQKCQKCERTFPAELIQFYTMPQAKPEQRIPQQILACPICVSEVTQERLNLSAPYEFPDNPAMQKKLAYARKLVEGQEVPVTVAADTDSIPEGEGDTQTELADMDPAEVTDPDNDDQQEKASELQDDEDEGADEETTDEAEEDEATDMLDREPSDAPRRKKRSRGKNK